jgi:hypothetical protein
MRARTPFHPTRLVSGWLWPTLILTALFFACCCGVTLIGGLLGSAVEPVESRPSATPSALERWSTAPAPTPKRSDAACPLVAGITIAPERPRAGYDRDLFGDYDRRALLEASLAKHGDYYSVWDGKHYADPGRVDVDHTVALAEAWDSGADRWDDAQRDRFAADPENLTLLTDKINQGAKGDNDPAGWLPAGPWRAEYLAAWTDVKRDHGLSMDPAEVRAVCAASVGAR